MPDEVNNEVIQLAKKEKRSKSAMAAYLIEEGLSVYDYSIPKVFTDSEMRKRNA